MGDPKVVPLFPEAEKRQAEAFSDLTETERKIWEAAFHDDDLGFIIRAHLIFEHGLTKLLEEHGAPLKERDGFADKNKLALSLGLISQSLHDALKKLNHSRNRFAHKLDAKLSMVDPDELIAAATEAAPGIEDANEFDDPRSRMRAALTFLSVTFLAETDPSYANNDEETDLGRNASTERQP